MKLACAGVAVVAAVVVSADVSAATAKQNYEDDENYPDPAAIVIVRTEHKMILSPRLKIFFCRTARNT